MACEACRRDCDQPVRTPDCIGRNHARRHAQSCPREWLQPGDGKPATVNGLAATTRPQRFCRLIHASTSVSMTATAKLFKHGGSQAVRLPKAFRFTGSEVVIEKRGDEVVLRASPKARFGEDWRFILPRRNRISGFPAEFDLPGIRTQAHYAPAAGSRCNTRETLDFSTDLKTTACSLTRAVEFERQILSSSVVERSTVNRLVVGSNPTSGATF